jgi:hypothetical protein
MNSRRCSDMQGAPGRRPTDGCLLIWLPPSTSPDGVNGLFVSTLELVFSLSEVDVYIALIVLSLLTDVKSYKQTKLAADFRQLHCISQRQDLRNSPHQ